MHSQKHRRQNMEMFDLDQDFCSFERWHLLMDSLYKYSYFTPLQIHFRQKSIEKDHNQQNVYNSKIPSIPQGKWLYIARRNVCRLCNKYYIAINWFESITIHYIDLKELHYISRENPFVLLVEPVRSCVASVSSPNSTNNGYKLNF